jgi:hypothetical protein
MSAKPIYPVIDLGELIQICEEHLRKRRTLWSSLKFAEPTQAEEEKLLIEAIEKLRRAQAALKADEVRFKSDMHAWAAMRGRQ